MKDHNGVLMMQRVLLAGTLGMAMARKAAAILEGEPSHATPAAPAPDCAGSSCTPCGQEPHPGQDPQGATSFRQPQGSEGAVLRAILDAANECLGISMTGPRGSGGATPCFTCSTWRPSPPRSPRLAEVG
jgi:hypothetical protein